MPDNISTTGFPTPVAASFGMEHIEISTLSTAIGELSRQIGDLKSALGKFNSFTANPFNSTISQIENQANSALTAVNNLTGAVNNLNPGGGGGAAAGGGGGGGGGGAQFGSGIMGFSQYLTGYKNPLIGIGMSGLEWLRDRVNTNRQNATQAAAQFGMLARQQGTSVADIMGTAARFPGGIYGGQAELSSMFQMLPRLGASFNFGGQQGGQGVRAAGMLAGIQQAQTLNPGENVASIMGNIGGFAANTRAQQVSQMLTGGAYSMIGAGGRQKSLSEWAESIMRWLENMRGGADRGKAFSYGELMAQYFPGSNIDAWFDANGVPANMKEYWWTYALGKANQSPDKTAGGSPWNITPDKQNLQYARLKSTSELTRTEFGVGAKMTPSYVNREQSNQWFNSLMGQIQEMLFSGVSSKLNFIQYLPDTVEDMLYSGTEMMAHGADQATGMLMNLLPMLLMGDVPERGNGGIGDIGDVGGYGDLGGTSTSGLSPNMRSKLNPMLRANPRLRVTSGLRDNAMQARLKKKGYSRVSGKPSAHTRGDAADLGPSSEYGWIMANAHRFGLSSGAKHGEPWHVGVGDPLDWAKDKVGGVVSDVAGGILGNIPGLGAIQGLLNLLGGITNLMGSMNVGGMGGLGGILGSMAGLATGNPAGLITAMTKMGGGGAEGAAKLSKDLLSVFLGPLAGLVGSGEFPGYEEGIAQRMAAQKVTIGGLPSSMLKGAMDFLGGGGGLGLGLPFGLPGLGTAFDVGGKILGGASGLLGGGSDAAKQSFSGTPSERAITVARLASQYWHGEDLIKAVAISGRESSWDPHAHRTDHRPKDPKYGDRGLFQINYSLDPSFIQKGLYSTPSDLFDPSVNVKAAYQLWKDAGGSWKPWAMTSHGWDKNGDPLYGAKVEEARAAIHSAGVGDVERMQYETMPTRSGGSMVMHVSGNTITISDQAARNLLGANNGTPLDVRRTVTLIADYLEDEMNRRMARAN